MAAFQIFLIFVPTVANTRVKKYILFEIIKGGKIDHINQD